MGLNDKKIGTISNKFRKITRIKQFIVDTIDKNQNVKRYMRYLTSMPLATRGANYAGEIVTQPDLKETLTKESSEGKRCLFGFGFNPDMDNCQIPYIFIQNKRDILGKPSSRLTFLIHIICPERYNDLKLYSQERLYEIASCIADDLDETMVEGEAAQDIGNIEFQIIGDVTEWRLTKSQDSLVISFPIICTVSSMRVSKDE